MKPVPLEEATFVALDTETTGLRPLPHRVIEIGAVRFNIHGEALGQYEQLINPEQSIDEAAQRVHRISDAMVGGQPLMAEALPGLLEFLGDRETIVLAHNAEFDGGFLAYEMVRANFPLPEHRIFDTLALARGLAPLSANCKLETLARDFALIESESHRALSDARVLMGVFLKLVAAAPDMLTTGDLAARCQPRRLEDYGFAPIAPPRGFEALDEAIRQERPIEILYESTNGGGRTSSIVTPRVIFRAKDRKYLAAYCHDRLSEKIFRLDRVHSYSVLPQFGYGRS